MRPGVAGALMGVILGGVASLVLVTPRPAGPQAAGEPRPAAAALPAETPGPLDRSARVELLPEGGGLVFSPARTPADPTVRPFPLPGGTLLWQRDSEARPGPAPASQVRGAEATVELAPSPTLTTH